MFSSLTHLDKVCSKSSGLVCNLEVALLIPPRHVHDVAHGMLTRAGGGVIKDQDDPERRKQQCSQPFHEDH